MLNIFKGDLDRTTINMALFGIVYFTIGFLLSLNIKFSTYLGLILPLIYRRISINTIRYLAACLLLLTGMLHMRDIFRGNLNPTAFPLALFGIVHFAVGFLLLLNIKYSKYLGLIFPLIELAIGFGALSIKYLGLILPLIELATGFGAVRVNDWVKLLFAIDAVVAICCVLLILKRVKTWANQQSPIHGNIEEFKL